MSVLALTSVKGLYLKTAARSNPSTENLNQSKVATELAKLPDLVPPSVISVKDNSASKKAPSGAILQGDMATIDVIWTRQSSDENLCNK